MGKVKVISQELFNTVAKEAEISVRRRKNYNFHDDYSDPINRMLNALEPDSYCQPHKHEDPDKREVFLVLQGRFAVFFFDDSGNITKTIKLSAKDGNYGVDIAPGVWHTLVSLESNSVAYEIKDGPYEKPKDKNFATWAPKENDPKAKDYLAHLKKQVKD